MSAILYGYQHVTVATGDGALHEEWFAGAGGPSGTDQIALIPGANRHGRVLVTL